MEYKENGEVSFHNGATPITNNFSGKDTNNSADMQVSTQSEFSCQTRTTTYLADESKTVESLNDKGIQRCIVPVLTSEPASPLIVNKNDLAGYENTISMVEMVEGDTQVSLKAKYRLPTDGLPIRFVEYCKHIAECRNVPLEVTLLSALTVAGAAIGGYVKLRMGAYVNNASLQTLIVASSTAGKSAPLDDIVEPLKVIDKDLIKRY